MDKTVQKELMFRAKQILNEQKLGVSHHRFSQENSQAASTETPDASGPIKIKRLSNRVI